MVKRVDRQDGNYPRLVVVLVAEPAKGNFEERLIAVEWSGKGIQVGEQARVGDLVSVEAFIHSRATRDGSRYFTSINGWRQQICEVRPKPLPAPNLPADPGREEDVPF